MKRKRRIPQFTKKMQIKLLWLFASVLLVLVLLNVRIAYINIKSGDTYTRQVLSQNQYDSQTIPYRRGEIRDRNGNVLARSEKVYNLILDCYQVNADEDYLDPTVEALVSVMGEDETELRTLITSEETKESRYQILQRSLTEEQKEAWEEYTAVDESMSDEEIQEKSNIEGVWFEEDYIREYPMDTLASNVIGYSNSNDEGFSGLEAYYSDVLNGTNGREYGYLNDDSELERTVIEPEHGNTLITTIDVNIQQIVEKYIAQFDEEHADGPNESANGKGSKTTAVIVADPNSGEILAMATNHSYDLNNPQDLSQYYTQEEISAMTQEEMSAALNDMWYNFCVSEAFEPGSTFKPVTVGAALESGSIVDGDTFYCDGYEFVTDTRINCDNVNGHGMETVSDAIKNSCNDALMQIAFQMGIDVFCKYQELFNFGSTTGIDLPNEGSGSLYNTTNMHEVELATNSFGQGFTCTMIQELAAFCAVVNGGYYYEPHMVKQILNADGGVVRNIEPVVLRQPISSKTSALLREYLEAGVLEGTGQRAQVPGYRVGGKTGTAEKFNDQNERDHTNYIVSFIGAVPINDPEVVIYVVMDEPNVEDQTQGGYCAIMAREILMEVLPYLNIPQTEEITEEQLNMLGLTWEEAQGGRIVETETQETNEDGTPVETTETDEQVADNPNIANPPADDGSEDDLPTDDSVTAEEIIPEE